MIDHSPTCSWHIPDYRVCDCGGNPKQSMTTQPPALPDIYQKLAPTLTAKLIGITARLRDSINPPTCYSPEVRRLIPPLKAMVVSGWARPSLDPMVQLMAEMTGTCPKVAMAALDAAVSSKGFYTEPGAVVVPLQDKIMHHFPLGKPLLSISRTLTPNPINGSGAYSGRNLGQMKDATGDNWRVATDTEVEEFVSTITASGWRYIVGNAAFRPVLES